MATSVSKSIDKKKFSAWLQEQGANVLAPTSQWELARFRAHGAVHVVYVNKAGTISAMEFAAECLKAFRENRALSMGYSKRRKNMGDEKRAALLQRDGDTCFYCPEKLGEDITLEHLVAKNKGGPDHLDNLVLAHGQCNQDAGSLPLVEKIKIHCASRAKQAAQ